MADPPISYLNQSLTKSKNFEIYNSVEFDNLVLIYLKNNIYQISHENTEENHVCCKIYNDWTEDTAT